MRLSEAIRKGCECTDRITGALLDVWEGTPGACALGAALVGVVGLDFEPDDYALLVRTFPVLDRSSELAPRLASSTGSGSRSLLTLIMSANDCYGLDRETIAGLLEEDGL